MMSAPDKVWVTERPTLMRMGGCHVHKLTGADEYHLSRPGQPCPTDEFMGLLLEADRRAGDMKDAISAWLSGDFAAAMEGLE